jgi:hypothetical protein
MICWNDPDSGEWDATVANQAGSITAPPTHFVAPEFVRAEDNKLVAYQPGLCIVMEHVGAPIIWSFQFLLPSLL